MEEEMPLTRCVFSTNLEGAASLPDPDSVADRRELESLIKLKGECFSLRDAIKQLAEVHWKCLLDLESLEIIRLEKIRGSSSRIFANDERIP